MMANQVERVPATTEANSACKLGGNEDKNLPLPDEKYIYSKAGAHPVTLSGTRTSVERRFAKLSGENHILYDSGEKVSPSGEYARILLVRKAKP